MVLMVVGALVLSAVVTLIFTAIDTREQTRHELVREAQGLALAVQQEAASNTRDPAASLRQILLALKSPLHYEGVAVLAVQPNGALFDPANPRQKAALPSGLQPATVEPRALLRNETVSGTSGAIVFAAVPYRAEVNVGGTPRNLLQVVVLTRRPPIGAARAALWLLASAAAIIAVAVMVARRLGRRFVRPLEAAQGVTRRIAAGDMDARVPEPDSADPELVEMVHSINSMAESLARARGAERQFLLSVSHELRTPLTSIRGYAEALCDGAMPDPARAGTVIARESRRLERLVQDLLDLSKLEAGRFSLAPGPVDVGDAVSAAAAGFVPMAAELGLALSVEAAPSGTLIATADPDRLVQVVANLVENALKYARSRVHVATFADPSGPVISVDDDGPGISHDDLPHVFDRLWRSSHQPGRQVGSGLGLAIVAELTEAMGGSVQAVSPGPEGGGTRMVVRLHP